MQQSNIVLGNTCTYGFNNLQKYHLQTKFIKSQLLEFWPSGRHRYKPFTSLHNQKEDKNQPKNNKQPEVPENQTAWNSNNQGIKETVNQMNRTSQKETGQTGGQREPAARWQTVWAELAEWETETQSWLRTTAGVAVVGETPSLTQEFVGKWG